MKHFYRYIRYLTYTPGVAGITTSPFGGICLRVEDITEDGQAKSLIVTFSICDQDILFDKAVATKIVDTRAENGLVYKISPSSVAPHVIAQELVQTIRHGTLQPITSVVELFAMANSILFIEAYEQLCENHRAAWEHDKMCTDVIDAMQITKMYKDKS